MSDTLPHAGPAVPLGAERTRANDTLTVAKRYALLNRLGAGGMGEVWRAHDTLTGETVAVKVLLPSVARSPASELRFQREIEAMARIDHPQVVPAIDAGRDPVVGLFFVMTLQGGRPLHEVGRGWSSWAELWPVVEQILDVLAHAHARGVIHRDIKPDNILIDEGGQSVLLDFGLARLKDQARSGTSAHDLLGTVDYAAPEQATGNRRRIGPWTDLYALGVMVYEIICDRLPFWAPSAVQSLMLRLDNGCPPLASRPGFATPVGLWRVLDRMIQPDIHKRVQHASEARDALAALAEAPLEYLTPGPSDCEPGSDPGARHNTTMTDVEAEVLLRERASRFAHLQTQHAGELQLRPLEPPLRSSRLIGRDELLMSLSRGLKRWCRDPKPGVLIVAGAMGTGKSRLAEELVVPFLAAGQLDGHRHFWASLNITGQGLRDLALSLASALGLPPEAAAEHMEWWLRGRGVTDPSEIDRLLGWLVPGSHPGTAPRRAPPARLLASFLRHCTAKSRPLVLWLDGLDVIDRNLVNLAGEIRLARLPVILLVTCRNAAPPEGPAPRWMAAATRTLCPLSDEAMFGLVEKLVALDAGEAHHLAAQAEGNPQKLIELVMEQRQLGRVVPAWPRWVKAPPGWSPPSAAVDPDGDTSPT